MTVRFRPTTLMLALALFGCGAPKTLVAAEGADIAAPPPRALPQDETQRSMNHPVCAEPAASCQDPGAFALARNSTATSQVRILTGRYESNLKKIMAMLPDRWDLVAVLKWSAYGNDIAILGPIAARLAPAVAVLSNEDAEALKPFKPRSILRIGPESYEKVTEAVKKKLGVQEFLGTPADLAILSRVAREQGVVIDASIFLFDHYGDRWGVDAQDPEALERFIASIDPRLVRVRGIFSHLGRLSQGPAEKVVARVEKFLSVACPVANEIAAKLSPDDPPLLVHWAATSELNRLRDPMSGQLRLPDDLRALAAPCLANPRIRFAIRAGSATYGTDTNIAALRPVLWWTAPIARVFHTKTTAIAVVKVGIDDGYPRIFKQAGQWGEVAVAGRRYRLAGRPRRRMIFVDVGRSFDSRDIFVGAQVCLFCDDPSTDHAWFQWSGVEPHDIAACATGVEKDPGAEPAYPCKGPVTTNPGKE